MGSRSGLCTQTLTVTWKYLGIFSERCNLLPDRWMEDPCLRPACIGWTRLKSGTTDGYGEPSATHQVLMTHVPLTSKGQITVQVGSSGIYKRRPTTHQVAGR